MEKSPEAFRTIREVAEGMDLPQHVLRFWETRFPQIRPLKRAGGRRYYRPDDVERLRLIKRLLYEEGYTIRGVQKLFRQQGAQALVQGMLEQRPPPPPDQAAAPDAADRAPVLEPFDVAEEAAGDDMESASEPLAGEPETAPPVPAAPALSAQDLDALRATLAGIREAQRILAQARAQDSQ